MDIARLQSLLPWRHPFLLIDRMIACSPHDRIDTLKVVGGDDLLSLAHRPAGARIPGLMVLEGMNQSAALLYRLTYGGAAGSALPLLGFMRAEFPGTATTGDTIAYAVRAVKMTPTHGLFEGRAAVNERTIVSGEIAFAMAAAGAVDRTDGAGDRHPGSADTPSERE